MSSKNYYVNGNTVRELDTPVRHNQRTRKEIEEARRRKNRRNAARRNRQRAMEMSRGYVVFLTQIWRVSWQIFARTMMHVIKILQLQ